MAHHPRIHVTGIKRRLGTRYTADTLSKPARLGIRWKPNVMFVSGLEGKLAA